MRTAQRVTTSLEPRAARSTLLALQPRCADRCRSKTMVSAGVKLWAAARGNRVVLNSEVWQGHFAEGLVWALSCAAGLNPGKRVLDVDGVDIQIGFPGRSGTMRSPFIEAQVKSCSNPSYVGNSFSYSIPVHNYNDLIGQVGVELATRRYLFLVHTPAVKSEYVISTESSSDFHHAIYWVDIMDHEPIDPETQSWKSVHVPKSNLLTMESLTRLVKGDLVEGRSAE
ncbi:DUF4365 domain-containing protein [Streptomyces sp. JL1001]|uniref:DUF4365 domain-containing protein n=1 Tax=Streptomyces sp. JL1001 TaxID=3078227 RepID=A0AAU8KI42_9ACTN